MFLEFSICIAAGESCCRLRLVFSTFQAILEMEDLSIQDETVDKSPKSEFSVELSNVHAKWLTVTEPEENIKKKKTKYNERSENHHIVNGKLSVI